MNNLDIRINEPCHENWNAMTPKEQGRFCGSCQKDVVDLTNMTDAELKAYFTNYSGSICGRFNTSQLSSETNVQYSYSSLSEISKKFIRAFALVFIMLVGVQKHSFSQEFVKGDVVYVGNKARIAKGFVYGSDGGVISNAHIQIWENGKRIKEVITDKNGNYSLNIKYGSYQVRVFKSGYQTKSLKISFANGQLFGDFELRKSKVIEERQIMGMIKMGKPMINHKPD